MMNVVQTLKRTAKNQRGFTLIEMMIVLFIIALLLLIIIPNATKTQENAQHKADDAIIKTVETEQALYKVDHDGATATVEQLQSEGYLTSEQVAAYQRAQKGD
ncbi:MAG: competence type IV pilus major pilin ComGC [Aerococcus sp.]|nr:competence type IV pilus major pilin ComGC [Aerococcus sp.]